MIESKSNRTLTTSRCWCPAIKFVIVQKERKFTTLVDLRVVIQVYRHTTRHVRGSFFDSQTLVTTLEQIILT